MNNSMKSSLMRSSAGPVAKNGKTGSRMRGLRENGPLLAMAAPGILFFLIFSYLPMGGLIIAFKNFNVQDGIFLSPWAGFKNFEFFLLSQDAARVTYNTLFLNVLAISICLVFQVGSALILSELKNKYVVMTAQSVLFLPYFISFAIVGLFSFALLKTDHGLVNNLLGAMNIQPVAWYNEAGYWPAILTIASVWKYTGYGSVIYLAAIMGINEEYYEAARIDGASRIQQIVKITIPCITPVIAIMTLLSVGKIFNADFGLIYNMTLDAGTLMSTTDVIDTYVYRSLKSTGDIGMASAAAFYQSIVGFVVVMISNALVRRYNSENALF